MLSQLLGKRCSQADEVQKSVSSRPALEGTKHLHKSDIREKYSDPQFALL